MAKMNEIKVSIVIPAYNAENTIERTIESILNQTLTSIEIIVIDDGSTDDTKVKCQRFLDDSRFRYIYKTNGGVSSARNLGISKAKGEYVGFVDADDTVSEKMYEKMYQSSVINNADICICDINRCKSNEINKYTDEVSGGVYNRQDIEQRIMKKCLGYVSQSGNIDRIDWCVLRRIFKRSFLLNNNIVFDETLSNSEDCLIVYTATINANTVVYLKDEYLYNNIISGVSLTRKYLPTYWEQRCQIIETIYKIAESKHFVLDKKMMSLFVIRCMWASYNNVALGFDINKGNNSYKEFKRIADSEYVKQALHDFPDEKLNYEWSRIIKWTKEKKVFTIFSYYKDIYGHSIFYHQLRKITKKLSK